MQTAWAAEEEVGTTPESLRYGVEFTEPTLNHLQNTAAWRAIQKKISGEVEGRPKMVSRAVGSSPPGAEPSWPFVQAVLKTIGYPTDSLSLSGNGRSAIDLDLRLHSKSDISNWHIDGASEDGHKIFTAVRVVGTLLGERGTEFVPDILPSRTALLGRGDAALSTTVDHLLAKDLLRFHEAPVGQAVCFFGSQDFEKEFLRGEHSPPGWERKGVYPLIHRSPVGAGVRGLFVLTISLRSKEELNAALAWMRGTRTGPAVGGA